MREAATICNITSYRCIHLNVRVYSSFRLHVRFGLLCSIGCLLVKLHILVKFLLYKLCYHLDGE